MLMRVCKKAASVLAIVMLLASVASASLVDSPLVGGTPSRGGDLIREIEGGLTVELKGAAMSSQWPEWLEVVYTVTPETDQVINVTPQGAQLFDNIGNVLNTSDLYIGGLHPTSDRSRSREIIEGVPTSVVMFYRVGTQYQVHESYARVTFIINGERIIFRNFPSRP